MRTRTGMRADGRTTTAAALRAVTASGDGGRVRRRTGLRRRTAAAVAAGAVVTAAAAGPVHAAPALRCGDVVTTSTTLTADLHCPTGPGLTLAPGVTLDLGGHTLSGDVYATGTALGAGGETGVRNGRLVGWGIGVLNPDRSGPATAVTISDLRAERISSWVIGDDGPAADPPVHSLVVERLTAVRTGGAVTGAWTALHVTDTTVRHSDSGVSCAVGPCTVERSTFADNNTGVHVYRSRALVTDSTFVRSNWGVHVQEGAPGAVMERNHLADNRIGAHVNGAMTVRGNTFVRSVIGVWTEDWAATGQRARVEANVFRAGTHGLWAAPGTSFRLNLAVDNTGWGIHAPRATNLGGNVAFGNGNEPQCLCATW